MIRKVDELDPEKYYYCTSQGRDRFSHLSKGKQAMIMVHSSLGTKPYISNPGVLANDINWEVREATSEEVQWIKECLKAGKIVDRPVVVQYDYQIF